MQILKAITQIISLKNFTGIEILRIIKTIILIIISLKISLSTLWNNSAC